MRSWQYAILRRVLLPADAPAGPLLVHCDAFRTARLVPRTADQEALLAAHVENLRLLAAGRPVRVPAFNYDFCRTGVFDADRDPSQVGPITEHVRTQAAEWRTPTPVFNVAGWGDAPGGPLEPLLDPFGAGSFFEELAVVAWYGAPFSSTTLIHYAERRAGGPAYRYDKDFHGEVTQGGRTDRVTLRYHVRPLGFELEYDWPRLAREADDAGVRRRLDERGIVHWAPAAELVELWAGALRADPLALLEPATRERAARELERLGRRFELADFEQA
jgi:aminoglycoside N3'-acetyltransferase